ncbi:hypothetical protein ABGN05_17760 [Aquibium sp. LZ166]|uniref:CcoQ/FixQ family Cbb3-type cytochrome c oxidase assembly chaperone n=1 Tax=Aquibium pacificus TaxID=3153579 RepID=A0ABV3SPM7_9HYPH
MDWQGWLRVAALLLVFLAAVLYFLRPKRFRTKPIQQPDNWQGPSAGPD